ncbi:MAG TPA: ATP-binding cassette domain-containing protein [Propionibacteriaceae bacterium]|nr:ATP-binding cassette domain-containing protein [Propionibacteriaceae bacterium]
MGTLLARLTGVDAGYSGHRVLTGIDLDVPAGRQLAILGPSGAGKSTLLRLLGRELEPSAGTVWFDPDSVVRSAIVHQDPYLYDWLTIGENIALGLGFSANRDCDPAQLDHAVDLLGLAPVVDRYPDEVSGGQAQRAALARALAISPGLLLLDEPFSALDPLTRGDLQQWLRRAVDGDRLTSVLVTHDLDEALVVADDIALIDGTGRIRQRWRNDEPARDAVRAHVHPLRSHLRRAFEPLTVEADDAEFSGTAARHG